eukprot:Skav226911  [mRNA]  locus=scaffold1147:9895:15585:+ [translate_table: standard]
MQQPTWGTGHLPFLAVGRVQDSITLAYYIENVDTEQQDQTQEVFQKLLKASSSKLAAGQRTRLQWNNGAVSCLMDEQARLLYCVVTSSLSYPERSAYQLLYDLRADVEGDKSIDLESLTEHSLNDKFQDRMRELVQRYERMQDDKRASVNVTRITDNEMSNDPLYSRAGRELQSANGKKWILLIILVAIIILVIIWACSGSKNDGDKDGKTLYM